MGDHPSRLPVAGQLMRPKPGSLGRATLKRSPIWSCTGRGLPSRPVTRTAGGLLPHRFTLARTPRKGPLAVCSLLRFPSGFPGWPLTSALLCGVRTFLDGEPRGLRRAARRDPTAATWLASGVYHRGRGASHRRGRAPAGLIPPPPRAPRPAGHGSLHRRSRAHSGAAWPWRRSWRPPPPARAPHSPERR